MVKKKKTLGWAAAKEAAKQDLGCLLDLAGCLIDLSGCLFTVVVVILCAAGIGMTGWHTLNSRGR